MKGGEKMNSLLFWILVSFVIGGLGSLLEGKDSDKDERKNTSSVNSDSESDSDQGISSEFVPEQNDDQPISNQNQIRDNIDEYPNYSD